MWLDLREAARSSFEDVDKMLAGCECAIVCPDTGDDSSEALEAVQAGLKAVLASAPDGLSKVVLLSKVGSQAGKGGFNVASFFGQGHSVSWSDIEDELTSTARTRSANRQLHTVIVRAGQPPAAPLRNPQVRCLPPDAQGGEASRATAAEALFQALTLSVNSNFAVVEEPSAAGAGPVWPELLLPFIGPELWRTEVSDAKRAVFFVQNWADEFFAQGKSAMRLGVKTPVQLRNTPSGVIFKFRPLTTPAEESFDQLEEGGIEFVAEEPAQGAPRLRARRCAYGWKVTVKDNSERALLDKFARDWAEVSAM